MNRRDNPVLDGFFSNFRKKSGRNTLSKLAILKRGPAQKVIFFYPGEEGTYMDDAEVTLYENGIVQIQSKHEETTVHLNNCEILWRFQTKESRADKIRLLRPKYEGENAHADENTSSADHEKSVNPSNSVDQSEKN